MGPLILLWALALGFPACAPRIPPPEPPRPPDEEAPVTRTDWTHGAVFYELFVRSFADSNGDGMGDLPGLIQRLDYLNDGDPSTSTDLGVDALWLMPVFASPSYHGYDVTDYEQIDPDYGTLDDFTRLCAEAHRRGVKIILDLVVNHTGAGHPWFLDSASSPTSAKRNWYVWSPTDPGWKQPWGGNSSTWHERNGAFFYGVFWGGMPDLNFRNPEVRAEIKRLAALWLARGADGFRLDAARYLIETGSGGSQQDTAETHVFWKELASSVRAIRQDAALVGEAWADTPVIARYYGSTATVPGGDELPLNFDFPLATQIIQGINAGEATGIAAKLAEVKATYPPGAIDAPFLTNHDQARLATQLGGSIGKQQNAAALLLTLPGSPFLYYGEEVGLQNGTASGDLAKRTPMPWDATPSAGFTSGTPWAALAPGQETANVATQSASPTSLLSRYRRLIHARRTSAALVRGALDQLLTPVAGSSNTLAYVRSDGTERVLVVHNLSDTYAVGGPYELPEGTAEPLFLDGSASLSGTTGSWRAMLPPRGTGVWRLR